MKKSKMLRVLAIFCVLAMGASLWTVPVSARGLEDIQSEIAEKKKELEALQGKIESSQSNKAAAEAALKEYEQQYNQLVGLIDEQGVMIQNTEVELEFKTEQLSNIIEIIQTNKEMYEARLLAMYEMNNNGAMLAAILNVNSFSELIQAAEAMQRISRNDTQALEELATQRETYEQNRRELENSIDSLNAELANLQENRDWCTAKMQEMQSAIANANLSIQQSEQQSEETEEAIKALEAEYARIFAEQQRKGSQAGDGSVRYEGPLQWPVPGNYRVTSYFGDPRSNTRYHYGIDIPAGTGTPIVACASGTVITSEWHYSYGYYIVIDHGGGLRTLYAHCSQLYVGAGTPVTTGDTIAAVGNTGDSFGSHLHLEVHEHGDRQNPLGSGYLNV